jgi:hypothetical protein
VTNLPHEQLNNRVLAFIILALNHYLYVLFLSPHLLSAESCLSVAATLTICSREFIEIARCVHIYLLKVGGNLHFLILKLLYQSKKGTTCPWAISEYTQLNSFMVLSMVTNNLD